MADISAASSGGGNSANNSSTGGEGKEVFNLHAFQLNTKKMDTVRSFMGIVSGCVAGVAGLTGWHGLVCFLFLHLTVSLSLIVFKMKCDIQSYTNQNFLGFLMGDIQKCGLSFMLFWTLFYGLVYLF